MFNFSSETRAVPVNLPLAVVACLALSLGSACSSPGSRPFSSLPEQSAGAPLEEPDEQGNGDPAESLQAMENSPSELWELHRAAAAGDVARVKQLVDEHPGRINDQDPRSGFTALHEAARRGHADVVQALIGAGAAARLRDKDDMTAVDVAIQEHHTEVVKIFAKTISLDSYLDEAVLSGHIGMTELVLSDMQEGKMNRLGRSDYHAKRYRERDQEIDLIDWLNGYYGINVESTDNVDVDGNTPLHAAAISGHTEIAKLLLQAGANVMERNKNGKTPFDLAHEQGYENLAQMLERIPELLEAAKIGDTKQVEALLIAGTFPDGATSLHLAANAGHTDVVRLLVNAGANINTLLGHSSCGCCPTLLVVLAQTMIDGVSRNSSTRRFHLFDDQPPEEQITGFCGETALLLAIVGRTNNPEPVKLLIQAGADPNIPTAYSGRTPLHWAMSWPVEREQVELVKLLIQAGADVNAADEFGVTPLQFSAEIGSVDSVKALISAGADVDFQRHQVTDYSYGEMMKALHVYVCDENDNTTKYRIGLSRCYEGFNIQDQMGNAPLHDAVLHDRVDVVRVLLGAGADVNATNNAGKTPLDLAEQQGHDSLAETLKAAGGQRGG